MKPDNVNHPKHYTNTEITCENCGAPIECIVVTERFNFNRGNALKYIWRCDLKNGVEDLKKAAWYIMREISRMSKKTKTKHIVAAIFAFWFFYNIEIARHRSSAYVSGPFATLEECVNVQRSYAQFVADKHAKGSIGHIGQCFDGLQRQIKKR